MQQSGTVVRLVRDRGFGFVRDTDSGLEFFFHRSTCAEGTHFEVLNEGDAVTFVSLTGPKGPRAEQVTQQ